ncbi:ester cyclase, partial [Acidobacteriota bacterium]
CLLTEKERDMSTRYQILTAIALLIFGLLACNGETNRENGQKAELEKQIWALMDVWASRDFDQIDNIFAAEGVYEDAADQSIYRGRQEIKDFMRECVTWAPDTKIEPLTVFVSGNKGAVEWVWSGTQTGDIPDLMPATGKSFRIRGVTIFEFEDGKIKKNLDYYNAARFLHQLGVSFDIPGTEESE